MKGMVYRSCVRSVMLYGSETWCLSENENEMAILGFLTGNQNVPKILSQNALTKHPSRRLLNFPPYIFSNHCSNQWDHS